MATLPSADFAPLELVSTAPGAIGAALLERTWGVSSETGRLTDVLLSGPAHLAMIPCNDVTRENLARGLATSTGAARNQHRALVEALEAANVRCHFVAPASDLPDLSFTRDAVLVAPWGLIELRPAAVHRRREPSHVAAAAARLGLPFAGRIGEGAVEGGDICMIRPGVLVIGVSGDRTDEAGAAALAARFEHRGWKVVQTRFDPRFLHLDTLLTMVSSSCAVACRHALDPGLLAWLDRLAIDIIPASLEEVAGLGANLLALGDGRILAPEDNRRLNAILERRGFEVLTVAIDQFSRCGGGVHCLTMPLRREEPAKALPPNGRSAWRVEDGRFG